MSADVRPPAGIWRTFNVAAAHACREPLTHFILIALALFAANGLIHGPQRQMPGESITVSQGRVQQIADSYGLLAGRMPSRAELQALVDDFIDEEVAYREAVAMGLDADDTIVRRRMRQKIEFLAEDADASAEPSDAQLEAWLQVHMADYRLPARIAFRQVLASSDKRGDRAAADAVSFLGALRSGTDAKKLGDPSMLPSALPLTTQQGVALLFGEAFASSVFEHGASDHADEKWFGPVASPLGAHDVLITSRQPASATTLEQARDRLRSDWIQARRMAAREKFHARLRERYRTTVEWPELYAGQPTPTDVPGIRRPIDRMSAE